MTIRHQTTLFFSLRRPVVVVFFKSGLRFHHPSHPSTHATKPWPPRPSGPPRPWNLELPRKPSQARRPSPPLPTPRPPGPHRRTCASTGPLGCSIVQHHQQEHQRRRQRRRASLPLTVRQTLLVRQFFRTVAPHAYKHPSIHPFGGVVVVPAPASGPPSVASRSSPPSRSHGSSCGCARGGLKPSIGLLRRPDLLSRRVRALRFLCVRRRTLLRL